MHAIKYWDFGAPDVLQWAEEQTPVASKGQVLIKVAAAGLNRADVMQRQGKYPPPAGASDILGMEVAGHIAAVGPNVSDWQVGDKVCALIASGGYAEYAIAPASHLLPVPPQMAMTTASALPETVITVYANVFEAGALQPGQTVLVHGGSSGIGTTAIQMIRRHGAKVFVTVGSDEKAEACRKLGANLVINYAKDDFVEAVKAATEGQGVDIVLDMVGGDYVPRNLQCLALHGRHVSIATQRGRSATIDMRDVMQKQLVITGSTLRARPEDEKARLVRETRAKIWPSVISGEIKPLIQQIFPIKQAAEAHKMMESGAHIGKIVLEVSSDGLP